MQILCISEEDLDSKHNIFVSFEIGDLKWFLSSMNDNMMK
jgi:hypothetical protein